MKKFKKIYIEITNICNLNCPFCSKDTKQKKELSITEFEYILKQINDYTNYLYLHVKGEPLLHRNLKEILELCNKYNKKVNITSNATLLKNKLDIILNSNIVRQINISLQSIVDINILENIIECANILSENNIQIQYRLWANNKYQEHILNKIKKYYNIETITNNTKLKNNLYLNLDKEFLWPNLANNYISNIGTCYGTRNHMAILADGTVVPCCLDSNGIIDLGNIFKEKFEDILNKERTKQIKENFQNNKVCEELCQKCEYRTRW